MLEDQKGASQHR